MMFFINDFIVFPQVYIRILNIRFFKSCFMQLKYKLSNTETTIVLFDIVCCFYLAFTMQSFSKTTNYFRDVIF